MKQKPRKTKKGAAGVTRASYTRRFGKKLRGSDSILHELSPKLRKVVKDIVARLDDDLRRLAKH